MVDGDEASQGGWSSVSTVADPQNVADPAAMRSSPSLAEFDRRVHVSAGMMTLLGAAVLGIGTLSPWVSYVSPSGSSLNRNAFQLGPGLSMTDFGPLLFSAAFLMAVLGILITFRPWRPNMMMAFGPTLVAGLALVNSWPGTFGGVPGSTTTMGVGGVLAWAGVALGVVATLVLLLVELPISTPTRA